MVQLPMAENRQGSALDGKNRLLESEPWPLDFEPLRERLPQLRRKCTILWRLSTFARWARDALSAKCPTLTRCARWNRLNESHGHCGRTGDGTDAGDAGDTGSAALVPNRRLKTSGSNGSAGGLAGRRGLAASALISPLDWLAVAETVATVCGDGGPKGFWLGMAAAAAVTGAAACGEARKLALTAPVGVAEGGEAEGWEPLGLPARA